MRSLAWKPLVEKIIHGNMSLIGDERVINLQRTKVYIFSDSVLCLGKISENPQSNDAWEERLAWFKSSPEYRTLDRIDGEPMEVEWKFPRIHDIENSRRDSKDVDVIKVCEPEQNKRGIIIMSMKNDIVWRERGTKIIIVLRILSKLQSMLEDSRKDVNRFWGLDPRRYGVEPYSQTGWRTG